MTVTFDVQFEIEGDYTPGRPPTHCSNPDSPAFSDPGDGPEFEPTRIMIAGDDCTALAMPLLDRFMPEWTSQVMEDAEASLPEDDGPDLDDQDD